MDNDFHRTHDIFALFEGLKVPDMDLSVTAETFINGGREDSTPLINGEYKILQNGVLN